MPAHRGVSIGLAALFIGSIGTAALAQQDVQITSEAISRTCADIHKTPQVTVDAPTVRGPNDVTLNCRLIGAAGATIAQVSPAEVCQRLNGSTEWYRGMGTQVFCRGGTAATTAAPTPRSFTINEDDITKACQRVHGDPQATAEPISSGPSGLVLNCRMANHAGIPFVTPEDVCEAKFGTRGWMGVAGSKTFVCQAGPVDKPTQTAKTASAADGTPEAWNDVPLTEEAMLKGCRALHGPDATANPLTYAPRNAGVAGWHEPVINCSTAGRTVAHKAAEACPKLSGTPDWYLTDFGRGTWMPGESPVAPRVPVCRGPGPLQYHAVADMGRFCEKRGFRFGNHGITASMGTGRTVPPSCFNNHASITPVSMADVCREVHRANTYEARGALHFCLPEGPPAPPVAVATTTTTPPASDATPCFDCKPLMDSIEHYERRIEEQNGRIAAQEQYIRRHEEGAKARRGREREAWQEVARSAAARLEGTKELRSKMEAELESRKAQLKERLGRCTDDECREVVTSKRPDLAPPPVAPPTVTTGERPPGQTTERPPAQTATTGADPTPRLATTERPPATPPAADPERASTSTASACLHHEAELTNGERVFHRLYVRGWAKSPDERDSWMGQLGRIKSGLEAPGRQAAGSTTRTIEEPSVPEFFGAIGLLQATAKPCEEVTIYIEAHGGLMAERHETDKEFKKTDELKAEFFILNSNSYMQDTGLGPLLKNFKPNVSVTVIMDSCFGGGFAGKGNIEESRLVQVIGLYTICVVLVDAINQGVDGAMKGPNNRATTAEVKDHMLSKGWPLGEPSDTATDEFLHRREILPRILPGYVPPPLRWWQEIMR